MTLRRYGAACAIGALAVMLVAGVARADVVNVAAQAGLQQDNIRTFSVAPLKSEVRPDYGEETHALTVNGDAFDDFFLVRHTPDEGVAAIPPSTLWYGNGVGFNESAVSFKKSGNNTDKHGCDWGDADVDGDLDLFCAIGLTQNSKNELWIQGPGGSFTERSEEMGLRDYFRGRYRYATFVFANNDLRPDIYVARYTGSCKCDNNNDGVIDYTGDTFPNELWINTTNGAKTAANPTGVKFEFDAPTADDPNGAFNLTQPLGAKKDNATCLQNVDFDHDGDEDILFCAQQRLKLFRNESGQGFTDISAAKSISGDTQDARLVYLDGDDNYDLVKLTKKALMVKYDNDTTSGVWRPWQTLVPTLTGGEALAFGFFDGDSRLDIYQLSSRAGFKNDQADRILLNTTTGWDIRTLPQVIPGSGDDVAAIDYDNDGNDEFLVTNGDRKIAGPLQLFDWEESAAPAP